MPKYESSIDKKVKKISKMSPGRKMAEGVKMVGKAAMQAIKGGSPTSPPKASLKKDGGFYGHMDPNKIKKINIKGC